VRQQLLEVGLEAALILGDRDGLRDRRRNRGARDRAGGRRHALAQASSRTLRASRHDAACGSLTSRPMCSAFEEPLVASTL
jgi:hypothetical protein